MRYLRKGGHDGVIMRGDMENNFSVLVNTKRLLIINLGGMGDILLSQPAVRALRQQYPQVYIAALVANVGRQAAESCLGVDEIASLELGFKSRQSPATAWNNLCVLARLRKRKFDLAINMRTIVSAGSALKLRLLLAAINPRVRVGRDTDGRGNFLDIALREPLAGVKYEMEYDCDTVALLGVTAKERSIYLPEDPPAGEMVGRFLREAGIADTDYLIGIHPGGKPSRRWPIERFGLLAQSLAKERPLRFVVTGVRGERALFEALVRHSAIAMADATGRFNFKELVALIRRCDLFITNDTGPLHVAAVLKRPLIAIFGPGEIVRYDPRNISDRVELLYHKACCAPCNKYVCHSDICMRSVSVAEVAAAAQRLIFRA